MGKAETKKTLPKPKVRFTFAWGAVTAGVICVIGLTWRILMTQGIAGSTSLPGVFSILGEALATLLVILLPSFLISLFVWRFRGYVAPIIALFWAIGNMEEARDSRQFDLSVVLLNRIIADSQSLQEIEWTIEQNGLSGGAIAIFKDLAQRRRDIQAQLTQRYPVLDAPILKAPLPANPSRTLLREASATARRVAAVIPHAARFEREAYQALMDQVEGLAVDHGASADQARQVAMESHQAMNRQLMQATPLYEATAREAETMALMFDFLVERYGAWRQKADGSFEFRWPQDASRFQALLAAVEDAKDEIARREEALKQVSF